MFEYIIYTHWHNKPRTKWIFRAVPWAKLDDDCEPEHLVYGEPNGSYMLASFPTYAECGKM